MGLQHPIRGALDIQKLAARSGGIQGTGCRSVRRKIQSMRITGMRPELGLARSVKLQTRRHTQQALKQIQREGVKPRAFAGKLKLVGGVAQKRVPEEVGGFRVHGRILSGCRRD
ncbi:MAG: hypothetical protein DPW14_16335 [Planctomycetes bacterium]|nr:hypothetical protein [Planctomycetota bacterium]